MTIGTKSSLIHPYHRSDVTGDPEVVINGSNAGGNSIVDHHDNIIIMPLEEVVVVEQQHTTDNNHHNHDNSNHDNRYHNPEILVPIIPKHIDDWMISNDVGEKLIVPEFDEQQDGDCHEYRKKNGWLGYDLIHDRYSPVRILNYYVKCMYITF